MTRRKVEPDKRKRVSQACDACKRSKLKCDGLPDCKTCREREKRCTYDNTEPGPIEEVKHKKRKFHSSDDGKSKFIKKHSESPCVLHDRPPSKPRTNGHVSNAHARFDSVEEEATVLEGVDNDRPSVDVSDGVLSRSSPVSGKDEEAEVFNSTRMLQDPSGRLLYIGDSGTLSFLQLIRTIVENVAGQSKFTLDPQRLRIVENPIALPPKIKLTRLLPDKKTADVLLDAYFVNTNGLVEVFNRKCFMDTYERCYSDPLNVNPTWLCLLYLVFAIGLVMAAPAQGSPADQIIRKLRAEDVDQGEVFYSNAKQLADPTRGFEDEDFWSIQALTLMSLYTLAISKRNASYAYFGMAVRSAFALGLHRGETMCIFAPSVRLERKNLWQSLFVMDRFLASCLGRPTAVRESDCSSDTFTTPGLDNVDTFFPATNRETESLLALEASVRSCHVIGEVLEKVYSQRKVSTKLAYDIADDCKGWQKELHPTLNFRKVASPNSDQGIAILHVNLFYYHSIILLTRPFFLFLMHRKHYGNAQGNSDAQPSATRMEKLGQYCVVISCQSIAIVQSALASRFLPRRNPFVIYFLLASALIVLTNEFSGLYRNPYAKVYIRYAIDIMQYCSETDPQARRLMFILTEFREVVDKHQAATHSRIAMQSMGHRPSYGPRRISETTSSITTHTTSTIHTILNPNQPNHRNYSQGVISPTSTPGHLIHRPSDPHISPLARPSEPNTNINTNITNQNNPLDMLNSAYFANYSSPPADDPKSKEPMILPVNSRQNSLDVYLDMSLLAGSNGEVGVGGGGEEVDFEKLWHWPSTGSGLTPGGALGTAMAGEGQGSYAGGNFEVNPNFCGFR